MRLGLYNGKGRWKIYRPARIIQRPWATFDMDTTLYREFATWREAMRDVECVIRHEARIAEAEACGLDPRLAPGWRQRWRQRFPSRVHSAHSQLHT